MKTLLALAVLALAGSSCVYYGGFARQPGSMANAPSNESTSTGEYFYPHGGGTRQRTYERVLAFEQMKEVCGGEYRIDTEAVLPEFRLISFTCTRDGGVWSPGVLSSGAPLQGAQ